jgi:MFS family permease
MRLTGWNRRGIPGAIWVLGLVSLFMDVSSEMIHAYLPLFLVNVLGASALTVGVIEGVAEATASITKVFSGALSDRLRQRKFLTALGYGLAAFTKPVFPLASSIGWVMAARFIDRIGKGVRDAPRDALIADIAPADLRGASYGLRQSLDTVGAFLGPLLAIVIMAASGDAYRAVFWIAVIPGFIAFGLIAFGVREPPQRSETAKTPRLGRAELARLGSPFWWITGVGAIFTLAGVSDAFLILRAQSDGLPLTLIPLVMVAMNVVYALAAYPVGIISDRVERVAMLEIGFAVLIAADLALGLLPGIAGLTIGVILWGLQNGFTQGVFSALVADAAPADLRGTAFGVFNLASGIALLAASLIAGALWDAIGPQATFVGGAIFTAVALCGLLARRRELAPPAAT